MGICFLERRNMYDSMNLLEMTQIKVNKGVRVSFGWEEILYRPTLWRSGRRCPIVPRRLALF